MTVEESGGFDPPTLDPAPLVAALDAVAGWRAHIETRVATDAYRVCPLVANGRAKPNARLFRAALDEFAPVWDAWLAETGPGGDVAPHIDPPPHREREFHYDTETFTPTEGVPFQVQHWRRHWATNDTDRRRVHLIIDRSA